MEKRKEERNRRGIENRNRMANIIQYGNLKINEERSKKSQKQLRVEEYLKTKLHEKQICIVNKNNVNNVFRYKMTLLYEQFS